MPSAEWSHGVISNDLEWSLKVTTFFTVKLLENGTKWSYTYNNRSRGSRMVYQMVPFSTTLNDPDPDSFKCTPLFDSVHCVSKNAPTLARCSFNMRELILIIFLVDIITSASDWFTTMAPYKFTYLLTYLARFQKWYAYPTFLVSSFLLTLFVFK